MILNEIGSGSQRYATKNIRLGVEDEFRVCKGNFIGIVRPNESQYECLVRDVRREGPLIYGSGMDYLHATTVVTQLLDALVSEP